MASPMGLGPARWRGAGWAWCAAEGVGPRDKERGGPDLAWAGFGWALIELGLEIGNALGWDGVNTGKRGRGGTCLCRLKQRAGGRRGSRMAGRQRRKGGLRRGQQGEDDGDRTRERAREAPWFGSGGRRLELKQRTAMA